MGQKKTAIMDAAAIAKSHGYALSGALEKGIADIENPQYRVAVVGKYQVGKSTLINKVFLGDHPLLQEGNGMFCKTAVATDIDYGPASRLEVFRWKDESLHAEEVCEKTIENPTEEDVTAATVSSDRDTRADLARTISRVRITTPNEALKGYTVLDTPGLDDPEKELLYNTTFRVVPSSDLALFVVGADKQFGQDIDDYIRSTLLGSVCAISRIMILVSYKPEEQRMSAEKRQEFVQGIKGTLASFGRSDIPVEMYCFDASIGDILNTVPEIRLTIRSFLEDNALLGREEKIANLLRMELETLQVKIAAELKALGSSEEEIGAAKQRIDEKVAEFKAKCETSFSRLQRELKKIQDRARGDVDLAVDDVFTRFLLSMENAQDLEAVQKLAATAETSLKVDLGAKMSGIGLKLREEVSAVIERYGADMADISQGWNLFLSDEFQVNRPVVAKIPKVVFDAIMVALENILLPGGWITALMAHLFIGKKVNVVAWGAKKITLAQMRKALDAAKTDVGQKIKEQVSMSLENALAEVKAGMEESNRAQVEAIRSGLDAGMTGESSKRRAELESARDDIGRAVDALA